MKLLLLSTSSSRNAGGLYNSVRNLGKEILSQSIFFPTIMAFNDEFTDRDIEAYNPVNIELYNIVGPSGVGFTIDLYAKMKRLNPDVIHVQGIYLFSSFLNLLYFKKNSKPYIISPRGMLDKWILNNNPLKKKIGFSLYESSHIKNAACLHALCIQEYKAIRDFGAINPIAVVPNGVFLPNELSNPNSIPHWKADGKKVLLFLGRIHPKKGIENLLRGWRALSKEKKDWKLVIAGESQGPEYLEQLKVLHSELQIIEDVIFIGPQFHEEKENTFRNADAFILPSFSEGMPMAILEAWSYKLPVIMTDACNLQEGFDNLAAVRIEPDETLILDGLKEFFKLSDENVKLMGINGFNLVKEKFTWKSIAEKMALLYKWTLDKSLPVPDFIRLD